VTASSASDLADSKPVTAAGLLRFTLWLLWQSVRLPLFLLLAILEPVVSFVLGAFALLGVLTALFWEAVHPAHFHFFIVLGVSLGFAFLLVIYGAVLRFLSR
jgi:hypothetical protein